MGRRRKVWADRLLASNEHESGQSTSRTVDIEVKKKRSLLGPGTSGSGGENEDIIVNDEPIPPQILAEIFMRIDNKISVACVCPLVCRRWYSVLSAPGFWIDYMRHRSRAIPPPALLSEPLLNMKKVCLKQPFERNLIDNPSGEKKFHGWTILENGGDRIIIERPPRHSSPDLDGNIPVAFVTSYGWGTMRYVIDLWEAGIEAAFLDTYRPPITVSEYYTFRQGCAATYALQVELVPDGQRRRISSRMVTRNDDWEPHDWPDERNITSDRSITRVFNMEQWSAAGWRHVEHTFDDYPVGIRFVVFQHSGKDLQFWAGHYGSKMAKASVIVHFGDGHRRTSVTVKENHEEVGDMDRDLDETAVAQLKDAIRTDVLDEMRAEIHAEVAAEIHEEMRQVREMMTGVVSEFNTSVQHVLQETMTMMRSMQEIITSARSILASNERTEQEVEERRLPDGHELSDQVTNPHLSDQVTNSHMSQNNLDT